MHKIFYLTLVSKKHFTSDFRNNRSVVSCNQSLEQLSNNYENISLIGLIYIVMIG